MDIKARLLEEAQEGYKKFNSTLIPNIDNVLGVRIPVLRKIAKQIYSSCDWKSFVSSNDNEYMELTMLQGFVIGLIKDDPENILMYVKDFVPKIDNWAVCDTFCSSLKFTLKHKNLVWHFIQQYLKSSKEFEIRFGVVMLLSYFIDEQHIDDVLKILDKIKHEGYYAKMAVAWAVSICLVKQQQKTLDYLKKSNLDNWTYNKSIQKAIESYRISDELKNILRAMKK